MIIFGRWRRITRNIWPTYETKCKHCNNENFFHLKRISTRFTLFFIPIIPYERYHFLYCPICEYWIKLDFKEVKSIKPIAKLNQYLVKWKITQEEYNLSLQSLLWDNDEEFEAIEAKEKIDNFKNCVYCWWQINKNAKKCKHCKEWIEQ